jgi:hypothetical protein
MVRGATVKAARCTQVEGDGVMAFFISHNGFCGPAIDTIWFPARDIAIHKKKGCI